MKKIIVTILFLFTVGGAWLMAQDVQPPETWIEALTSINTFMATLAGVAALTVFLSGAANKVLNATGFVKQLVAWVIAIVLAVLANLVNIGMFAEMPWLNTIIYGLGAGFVANGIFDVALVKGILKALKLE